MYHPQNHPKKITNFTKILYTQIFTSIQLSPKIIAKIVHMVVQRENMFIVHKRLFLAIYHVRQHYLHISWALKPMPPGHPQNLAMFWWG
jgi:hypothetical protein